MSERGTANWRAWLAAGIFTALMVAALLLVRSPEPQQPEPSLPAPREKSPAPAPTALPPLTRADLIDAAALAADAHARGTAPPAQHAALAGRRFVLRLPLACPRGAGQPAQAGAGASSSDWSYDSEEQILRVAVAPEVWTEAEFLRTIAEGVEFEAAEGFWISRPWIRSGECPASAERDDGAAVDATPAPTPAQDLRGTEQDAAIPAPPRETLALIELFESGSRRAARRNGRPYEFVGKIESGEIDLRQGLRLVIEGRLAPLAYGQPIACRRGDPELRPLCGIGAQIQRVAITDASGERLLAEWTD